MIMHMSVSISGLKNRLTGKVPKRYGGWQVLERDGRMLTKDEVWEVINHYEAKGFDAIPTCDNYDDRGHCKGHEKAA